MSAACLAAPVLSGEARADIRAGQPLHGLSAFGDLKYPPDFTHFDYANPQAPKGGTFNFSPPNWIFNQNVQTFNTLNTFVAKGDAPPRMELCFDSLMVRALDEPDAIYGLLAESVVVSEDGNRFEFHLRAGARFHDGSPVSAGDVAASYMLFKERGHPSLLLSLSELENAVALDEGTVRLTFSGLQSPRAILSIATFPVVAQSFFEEHRFDGSQLKAPLGSGPYRVGRVVPGQSITYERVEDYWAAELPVRRGLYHFDRIRIDFYRDRQAGFEAFKKGEVFYRQEFTSKVWASEYDFPAIVEGKVVMREFPAEKIPTLQAWAVNQRRERFRDPRVRKAIAHCFDFEATRRNFFHGAYERSHSLFAQSQFVAHGPPSAPERALLETLRGEVPEEAFGAAVEQPRSDGSGRDRRLLREAAQLLEEAGFERKDGWLTDAGGERLSLEMLERDPVFVRVNSPFVRNMRAIGIDASIRVVDAAQYQARLTDFEFDMVSMAQRFPATPTRESLELIFHSRAVDLPGSRNLPGTSDPAIDHLLELIGNAADRDTLEIALRVLDRVLRARWDWIPNWHAASHRAAFWDMFGYSEPKPEYGFPVEALWWHDVDKARAIGKA